MPISGKFLILIAIVIGLGIAGVYFFSPPRTGEKISEIEIFNPELLDWQEVTSTIPWSQRDSHALVVFKDKMWLLGGLNGNGFVVKEGTVEYWKAPHFSDIWVSEDGANWNLATDKAAWGKRRSIQVVVFKDKMWLMGGWGPIVGYKNDTWFSEDGINWLKVTSTASWPVREGHSLVVFKDKMWLIGGVNYDKRETKNDVWYSEDGVNWFEATSSAQWSSRWDHAVTVYKNKLWLLGGMDLNGNTFKDVWSSEDGKNWTLVTDNPPWQARQGHSALVFQDKLWLIGQLNDASSGGANDVWFSEDGLNWTKTKNNPSWLGREDFSAVVFKDEIWITAGMDTNWTWRNDVWHSVIYSDIEPDAKTIFYPVKIPFGEKLLAQVSQIFQTSRKSVEVDLSQQKMKLVDNGQTIKEFSVVTGAAKTPTPTGNFKVYSKYFLVYSNLAKCWLPYWVGFTADGLYGFHMIPVCQHVLSSRSLGCVRLQFEDAKFFHNWVEIGTPIKIY